MSGPIQWLLIGGPAHGTTLWISHGARVLHRGEIYEGENYLHDGRLYRVGRHAPVAAEADQICNLIESTRLRAIA